MTRNSLTKASPSARGRLLPRPGLALLVALGVTVASFATSTAVVQYFQGGIRSAAESITANSAPSVYALITMRTEVRHFEILLDDYIDALAATGRSDNFSPVADALTRFDAADKEYRTLPQYPGEQALWAGIDASMTDLHKDVAIIQASIARSDASAAEDTLNHVVKPRVDELDARLGNLIQLNAEQGAHMAAQIDQIHKASRRWALVLDAASALFAGIAAFVAIRVLRNYAWLMERRIDELDQFAVRVSHDIRTPLTSVGLTLELVRRRSANAPELEDALARAERTLERASSVIEGLLAFAKTGAPGDTTARTNVRDVVSGVIDEFRDAAVENRIAVSLLPFEECFVKCTDGVLTSLISNLVGNAIKYMGDAPLRQVTISVRAGKGAVQVQVADTGPGIPRDQQAVVFEPYVRGQHATVFGLGLGLATVRRLAEAHGGSVGLQSTTGRGSTFWFELPRAD